MKYQAFVIPLVPNGVEVLLNLYSIGQKSQGVCSYPSSQSCTCFKLDSSNNKIMLYQILSCLSQTFCCKKVFQLEYWRKSELSNQCMSHWSWEKVEDIKEGKYLWPCYCFREVDFWIWLFRSAQSLICQKLFKNICFCYGDIKLTFLITGTSRSETRT